MGRQCSICQDDRIAAINADMLEGIGSRALAEKYGYSTATLDAHRTSGHPARSLTRAVLGALTGPQAESIAELAKVQISSKAWRMQELQWLYERCKEEVKGQGVGSLDARLVQQTVGLLMTGAKEMGDWAPGGNANAEVAGGTNITVNHFTGPAPARGNTIEHPPQRPAKRLPNPPETPGILQQLSIDGSPEVSEVPSSDSCKSGKLDLGVLKGGVEVAGAARPGPAVEDSEGD